VVVVRRRRRGALGRAALPLVRVLVPTQRLRAEQLEQLPLTDDMADVLVQLEQ
jgi:hypothetical protein